MVKINFDSNYLINSIKPNVDGSIELLQKAYNNLQSTNLPTDFPERNLYNDINKNLLDDIKKLQQFNDWIYRCNKTFSTIEDEHSRNIKAIDDYKIPKHEVLR